jgi:4-amino-4-deoxy-L-arabinose transferase-like glycosyltransferase
MAESRLRDYTLVIVLGLALFLPGLGSFALWDDDEAHNAECAREMAEAQTWVVPYFNFKLRTDKPALLYWCILLSYQCFGVQEWAARLPSALASIGSLLVTYELGRHLFGRRTGLLAATILGTSLMFNVVSHAVTPDALLIFCTLLSFLCLVRGYAGQQRWWLAGAAVATGFAVLAKGPVGVALPGATAVLFLLWERRLKLLWQKQLVWAILLFAMVAVPWYLLVGLTTHWEFTKGFFLKHNLNRFQEPMEGHRGSIFYHPLVLLATFAPWSAFLGLTVWYGVKGVRFKLPGFRCAPSGALPGDTGEHVVGNTQNKAPDGAQRNPGSGGDGPGTDPSWPYRFLWCWIAVWLVVFSVAATKLPNYVLPMYPALALLTSRFLVRWWEGSVQPRPWLMHISLGCFAFVGFAWLAGLLAAANEGLVPKLQGRTLPDIAPLAWLGQALIVAAVVAYWGMRVGHRQASVIGLSLGAICFVGGLAALGPEAVDRSRAAKPLAALMREHQEEPEVQIGCHPSYYRPGVVFYSRREVRRLMSDQQAMDLLRSPLQAYLLIAEQDWGRIAPKMDTDFRIVGRHHDVTAGQEILLVTNRPTTPLHVLTSSAAAP